MGTTRTWRGSMLAVETFKEHDEAGGDDLRIEETGREEAQLGQTTLGRRDAIDGFRLVHRQRKVDRIDAIRHGVIGHIGRSEYRAVVSLFEK